MILSVIMLSMLVASAHYGQISSAPARSGLNADGKPYSRLAEAVAIMHCLTKVELNWLGESLPAVEKTNTFRVGLRHDKNTYPGEDVIIVVVLESATRGDVFELRGERRQQGREYNLENNGSFKLRHKQFTWPNEIFGGIWTHRPSALLCCQLDSEWLSQWPHFDAIPFPNFLKVIHTAWAVEKFHNLPEPGANPRGRQSYR